MLGKDVASAANPSTGPDGVSWSVHDSLPDDAGFVDDWDALAARHPLPGIFLTWDWIATWWRHFGAGRALRLVVARRDGQLVAAAPLAIGRKPLLPGRPARVLELIGTAGVPTRGMGLADRADVLFPADEPALHDAVLRRALAAADACDLLWLRAVPQESGTPGRLRTIAREAGRARDERFRSVSPYATLGTSWKEFLAGRDGKVQRRWRNSRRRLEKLGSHAFAAYAETGFERAFDDLLDIARRSYKWKAGSSLYQAEPLRAFYRDLFGRFAGRGRLTLDFLSVDGKPVAYQAGFRFASRRFAYDASYDEAFADGHPGVHLVTHAIEQSIAEGLTEYDMMRGEEPYKARWATGERTELHVALVAPTWPGRLTHLVHVRARDKLKRVLER